MTSAELLYFLKDDVTVVIGSPANTFQDVVAAHGFIFGFTSPSNPRGVEKVLALGL